MERAYKSLSELLAAKPAGVHTVNVKATVRDALEVMAEKDIGAVLVIDRGKLVGILTERDYARKGVLAGRLAKDTPVREMMTTKVVTVTPRHTVQQCMDHERPPDTAPAGSREWRDTWRPVDPRPGGRGGFAP